MNEKGKKMNLFETTQAVCSTFDYNPNPNGVLQSENPLLTTRLSYF